MTPITYEITDVLDLHTFNPKEVVELVNDYLTACHEKKIDMVRIVHGKGAGILKRRVHSILSRHPLVNTFTIAPPEAGGWGATLVQLTFDRNT